MSYKYPTPIRSVDERGIHLNAGFEKFFSIDLEIAEEFLGLNMEELRNKIGVLLFIEVDEEQDLKLINLSFADLTIPENVTERLSKLKQLLDSGKSAKNIVLKENSEISYNLAKVGDIYILTVGSSHNLGAIPKNEIVIFDLEFNCINILDTAGNDCYRRIANEFKGIDVEQSLALNVKRIKTDILLPILEKMEN